jgi:hypothetical protein
VVFFKSGDLAINLGLVSHISRHVNGDLEVHMVTPRATTAPGMYPAGSSIAGASDHEIIMLTGQLAIEFWNGIK